METQKEFVLDPTPPDVQRVVSSNGRFIHTIDKSVVDQAVQRQGMTSAMRMASLHADPDDKVFLLESLEGGTKELIRAYRTSHR